MLNPENKKMVFVSFDADDAGARIGNAIISDDRDALKEASEAIQHGQEILKNWADARSGQLISMGADSSIFEIPAESVEDLETVRRDYEFATGITTSCGVGLTLSESGKALVAAKNKGRDQVVFYESGIENQAAPEPEAQESDPETDDFESHLLSDGSPSPASDHESELDASLENQKDMLNSMDSKPQQDHESELDASLENQKDMLETMDSDTAQDPDLQEGSGDMGLSEDGERAPGIEDVMRDGLDAHSESIKKEKIVNLVSQALEGFKANKEILERAKEKAPELYASTLSMMKAMIEMCKLLGLTGSLDSSKPEQPAEEPEQDPAAPEQEQEAAVQEDVAQDPKT